MFNVSKQKYLSGVTETCIEIILYEIQNARDAGFKLVSRQYLEEVIRQELTLSHSVLDKSIDILIATNEIVRYSGCFDDVQRSIDVFALADNDDISSCKSYEVLIN